MKKSTKKNLTMSFSTKALVITNRKTNESIAAVLDKKFGIVYHKRFDNNKKSTIADKLFTAIRNFIATFKNKKYTYKQRLALAFKILRGCKGGNTFSKLYNRFTEDIQDLVVNF